jgi:hypothetical protein
LKAMRLSRAKRVEDLLEKINVLRKAGNFSDLEKECPSFVEKNKMSEEKVPQADIQPTIKKEQAVKSNTSEKKVEYDVWSDVKKNKKTISDNKSNFIANDREKSSQALPVDEKTTPCVLEEKNIVVQAVDGGQKSSATPPPEPRKVEQEEYSKKKSLDTPEKLWHKLISDMDRINQPQLKFYLQEAKPKSLTDNSITVSYDEEFGTVSAHRVNQEKDILNKCLQRITGNYSFKFILIKEKGISSPVHGMEGKDLDEVKKNVEENPFVKETIKAFNGRIVDFRG